MAQDLRFLAGLVLERANQLLRSLPSVNGHGASLTRAMQATIRKLSERSEAIVRNEPYSDAEEGANIRELQRMVSELDVLYSVLSTFKHDIGRSDVPMGLLYIVDELVHTLLPSGADPLLHLDYDNMYSTWSIFHSLPAILDPSFHPQPHPVAFNIPGLDSANALLAPILAHEVGHTCWQRGIGEDLQAELDVQAIEAQLQTAVGSIVSPQKVMDYFSSWLQETMCDAIAVMLTGPSFLFASSVFLPAAGQTSLNTHPYPRDRIALMLRILDRCAWTPTLQDLVGDIFDWCSALASSPDLTGDPLETALRSAMQLAEPAIIEIAERYVPEPSNAVDFLLLKDELFSLMDLGVPPISAARSAPSSWEVISGGWLHEIRRKAEDGPAALPSIAVDARINRFLLKTIELSGIVKLWSSSVTTSP